MPLGSMVSTTAAPATASTAVSAVAMPCARAVSKAAGTTSKPVTV